MLLRKIHINKDIWTYKISSGDFAVIWSPNKVRYVVTLSNIVDRSFRQIQAARYPEGEPGYWVPDFKLEDGMIKPSDIKKYILKNLIK